MKTITKKQILRWTGYADDQMIADYQEQYNDSQDEAGLITLKEAGEMLSEDQDYWDREWEYFCEWLGELMGDQVYWRDDASRMGWLNRTGYKVFKAETGQEFIRAISPDTDCSYTITPYYKGFKARISHHDAPTGEYHTIKPITEAEYEKLTN